MTAIVPTETMGSTHHERRKIFIPRRTPEMLGCSHLVGDDQRVDITVDRHLRCPRHMAGPDQVNPVSQA